MTTLAPITLPYFEKIVFRSLALVMDDKPDTQRLRLDVFVVDDVVDFVSAATDFSANFYNGRKIILFINYLCGF